MPSASVNQKGACSNITKRHANNHKKPKSRPGVQDKVHASLT